MFTRSNTCSYPEEDASSTPQHFSQRHSTYCLPYIKKSGFIPIQNSREKYRFLILISMLLVAEGNTYEMLPKISENLNIPRKPLALRTCATRCLLLYLSTVSQPTCVFIRARVSEFWLFSLHRFHVCQLISKWWMLRSKEFASNFASCSTKLQLKPTEC